MRRRERKKAKRKLLAILRAAQSMAWRLHGCNSLPAVLSHYGWGTNFSIDGAWARVVAECRRALCFVLYEDVNALPDITVTWRRPPAW